VPAAQRCDYSPEDPSCVDAPGSPSCEEELAPLALSEPPDKPVPDEATVDPLPEDALDEPLPAESAPVEAPLVEPVPAVAPAEPVDPPLVEPVLPLVEPVEPEPAVDPPGEVSRSPSAGVFLLGRLFPTNRKVRPRPAGGFSAVGSVGGGARRRSAELAFRRDRVAREPQRAQLE
jgi:hypothetical protein